MTAPTTMRPVQRRRLAGFPGFAAVTLVLIASFGWLLTLIFRGPGDLGAIVTSAVVAAAVQIGAFPAVRGLTARNIMIGWGAGALARLGALIVYAVLARTVLNLPLPAALMSLAVFYFLSMIVEPLFLRP